MHLNQRQKSGANCSAFISSASECFWLWGVRLVEVNQEATFIDGLWCQVMMWWACPPTCIIFTPCTMGSFELVGSIFKLPGNAIIGQGFALGISSSASTMFRKATNVFHFRPLCFLWARGRS